MTFNIPIPSSMYGPLEIVTAIRQIEALVTQWKVRDLLAAQGHGQADPIVKRGIDDFVSLKFSRRVGECHMAKLAPPSFDERDGQLIGRKRFDFSADRASGKRFELFLDERHRPLHFQPAHVGPGEYIAAAPGGDRNVSEAEYARRLIV